MRNESDITAIATKLATAISQASGITIPAPATAEEAASLDYQRTLIDALTPEANAALDIDPDEAFINGTADNAFGAIMALGIYAEASASEENEHTLQIEADALADIPARYLPDRPNGRPRTDTERLEAESDLLLATGRPDETSAYDVQFWHRSVVELAGRVAPEGFSTEGGQAEKALAAWAYLSGRRDDLVRAALNAGVSKHRIHVITGISRSTIDRLLGSGE